MYYQMLVAAIMNIVCIATVLLLKTSFATILIIISVVLGIIEMINAFTSVGQWNALLNDLEDQYDFVDYNLGYSWYLMLFSGIFAICAVINYLLLLKDVRAGSSINEPLNKS